MPVDLFRQQPGVHGRMSHQKGSAEAGRKRHLRLDDSHLGASHSRRVAGEEVVHRLLTRQTAHRRQHSRSIAGEKDQMPRVPRHAGHPRVWYALDWIGRTGIFCNRAGLKIDDTTHRVVDNVFQHGSKANRRMDFRLLVRREMNALGIAAAFDIEHASISPAMLIIADQPTQGIGRKRCLAGAGQTKKQRDISRLPAAGNAFVRGAMHR